jgi:hypothetical protein
LNHRRNSPFTRRNFSLDGASLTLTASKHSAVSSLGLCPTIAPLIAYLTRLRFPVPFAITAVYEILLGLGAALLGSWKKRKKPQSLCLLRNFTRSTRPATRSNAASVPSGIIVTAMLRRQ